ncbi:hypothetical protein [Frankia sp. CiP3]|uniref:hypothetical protein n=1 Tax=Frankia sp. CiP3 TaxID=2880971 RepID=UPI001EF53298|nr:hypothetical protein [Frankia sp. CiP3]
MTRGRLPTSTMRVGWLYIRAESWQAGTRTLTCTITFTDAAGHLTPSVDAPTRDAGAEALAA